MKKRLEFVMDSEEYYGVANIVNIEKHNVMKMADKLVKTDIPKETVIDFLYCLAAQLDVVNNVLDV